MTSSEIIIRCNWLLENRTTPEQIYNLNEDEVFVFGAKPDGNHSSGAAKVAVEKFGAQDGVGEGFRGQSYAIPVHRHRISMMEGAVELFTEFARTHLELKFFILPIGCGKAGMNVETVAKMFADILPLDNIYLPADFLKAIKRTTVIQEFEDLPIIHVREVIDADVLRGRVMGLLQHVSNRTAHPITFDDDLLKKDNILLFAFLRVARVITPEEQRVMDALMDESKYISESDIGKESDNGTFRALEFVKGWKLDGASMFDKGGCIYDLLSFTDREWFVRRSVL